MSHKTIQVRLRYVHLAPQHQLEAVQRVCDTGSTQEGSTDPKTSISDLEQAEHQIKAAVNHLAALEHSV
jgi:hypothetical protein